MSRRDFGTVYAAGSPTAPRFFIRWMEGTRRRKLSGFKSKTAAQEALARLQTGLADGTSLPSKRDTVTFDRAAQEWLRDHSAVLTKRSHPLNLMNYRKHVKPFLGHLPLPAVDAKRIFGFRAHVDAKGLSPATVNLQLSLVRCVLRHAVVAGHLAVSPTSKMGRGSLMLEVPKKKLKPPIETKEDVGRLLDAVREIRPDRHALFATLVYTGMRKGECCALRWEDVDFRHRVIHVRRSYAGITKSGKEREVPIPVALAEILRAHKVAEPFQGAIVFPNDRGEMYTKNGKLEDVLRPALARAGLPKIRIHDLRHTYVTFFLESGSIYGVSKNLGHHSATFTDQTYGHLSRDHRVREADHLDFTSPQPAKVLPFRSRG